MFLGIGNMDKGQKPMAKVVMTAKRRLILGNLLEHGPARTAYELQNRVESRERLTPVLRELYSDGFVDFNDIGSGLSRKIIMDISITDEGKSFYHSRQNVKIPSNHENRITVLEETLNWLCKELGFEVIIPE